MKENTPLGAFYIFLAALSFSIMGVLVKYLTDVNDSVIVFFRYAISLVAILPLLFIPKRKPLATNFFVSHLVRAIAGLLAVYCLYYSIRHLMLADAVLLNNTMPLFVPLVMFLWKGERFPAKIFLPLFISFVGVLIILRPTSHIFNFASIVALASGLFMAISTCGVRELSKSEPLYQILFYLFAIGAAVSIIPLFWTWHALTWMHGLLLCAVALFSFLYQYFIVLGYRVAPPTKVSSVIYLAVIISGLFDWIFWHQVPKIVSVVGLILIFVGAYFCMKIEHKVNPEE